jgi:hypothetical protein
MSANKLPSLGGTVKFKSSPPIDGSAETSGLSRSNLADGAYRMVFTDKKVSSKASDLQ